MDLRQGNRQWSSPTIRITVTFFITYSIFNCLTDAANNTLDTSPCSVWPGSVYFRGVCWKISSNTVLGNDTQTECSNEYETAVQVAPYDDVFIRLFTQLPSPNADPVVWYPGMNRTHLLDNTTVSHVNHTVGSCIALHLTSEHVMQISCDIFHSVVCSLEVGSPCDQSLGEGDFYESSCYYRNGPNATWDEAQEYCTSAGGHLVEIDEDTEGDFIKWIISLMSISSPVMVGARQNSSTTDPYMWTTSGLPLKNPPESVGYCVALKPNSSSLDYKNISCENRNGLEYLCEQDAYKYEYFIVLPATIQSLDTNNTAAITMATSSNVTSMTLKVYISGVETKSTSFLLFGTSPIHYNIEEIDRFLLTDNKIYQNAIYVVSYGTSDVSLRYLSTSHNGEDLTSAEVTIYPSIFLETLYAVMASPVDLITGADFETISFLTVVAIDTTTTEVEVHFPTRVFPVTITYNQLELSNVDWTKLDLKQFQSIQIESKQDLSGTVVKANNKVAVYSGNKRVQLSPSCPPNYVMAMSLPYEYVTNFYLVAVPTRLYFLESVYRVMAIKSNTNIMVYDENKPEGYYVGTLFLEKPGSIRDFPIAKSTIFVSLKSSLPFLLAELGPYNKGENGTDSHDHLYPCFMPLPSSTLYGHSYKFDPKTLMTSWTVVVLVIIGQNINTTHPSVRINEKSIHDFVQSNPHEYHGVNDYNAIILDVADRDRVLLFDTLSSEPFLVKMYWKTQNNSFCRVLGLNYQKQVEVNLNYSLTLNPRYLVQYQSHITFGYSQVAGSGGGGSSVSGGGMTSTPPVALDSTTASNNISNQNTTMGSVEQTSEMNTNSNTNTNNSNSSSCIPIPATFNLSDEVVNDLVKDIQKKLVVNPRSVSSFTRKYISISDSRPSSTTFGVFGIGIFSFAIGTLLLSDIITFIAFVFKWAKILKLRYYG